MALVKNKRILNLPKTGLSVVGLLLFVVVGFQNCAPADVSKALDKTSSASTGPIPADPILPPSTSVPTPTTGGRDGSTANPFNGSAATVARDCNLSSLKSDISNGGVVEHTYCLVLDRKSDVGGRYYWEQRLQSFNGLTRYAALQNFARVFPLDRNLVVGLYTMFNNSADTAGINFWAAALQNGNIVTHAALFSSIFECTSCASNMAQLNLLSDDAYVRKLHTAVARVMPSDSSYGVWMAILAGGNLKRSDLIRSFFQSRLSLDPALAGLSSTGFIVFVYQHLLGREPDQPGYLFWIKAMNSGLSRLDFVSSIVTSAEFQKRYPSYFNN